MDVVCFNNWLTVTYPQYQEGDSYQPQAESLDTLSFECPHYTPDREA